MINNSLRVMIPEPLTQNENGFLDSLRNVPTLDRKVLGDFFEVEDYITLIKNVSSFFIYNNFIKQFICLTPIDRVDCLFLKVKNEYILADLMFFMAIYYENKLKLESGGIDLD